MYSELLLDKMKIIVYILFYILPLVLYSGFIIYLSSLSDIPTIRSAFTKEPISKDAWTGDELEHIFEYGLLAFLFNRSILPTRFKNKAFLLTIIFIVLFGLFDEIHQYFVPKRSFSIIDLVWDFIGGLTTRITSRLFYRF